MKTYKLGNKVDCIIRSFSSGKIGDMQFQYGNQPYTILKDVNASLNFQKDNINNSARYNVLSFNAENLKEVVLYDVEINDKILKLIFPKEEEKLASVFVNCFPSEDGYIYLNFPTEEVYQVFIYDVNGNLEKAFGTLSDRKIKVNLDEDYLVFYSYPTNNNYNFKRDENLYLTLDMIVTGNTDDSLSKSYIHINKCAVQIDKNLSFNNTSNNVDLRFIVLEDGENYISLEE